MHGYGRGSTCLWMPKIAPVAFLLVKFLYNSFYVPRNLIHSLSKQGT